MCALDGFDPDQIETNLLHQFGSEFEEQVKAAKVYGEAMDMVGLDTERLKSIIPGFEGTFNDLPKITESALAPHISAAQAKKAVDHLLDGGWVRSSDRDGNITPLFADESRTSVYKLALSLRLGGFDGSAARAFRLRELQGMGYEGTDTEDILVRELAGGLLGRLIGTAMRADAFIEENKKGH